VRNLALHDALRRFAEEAAAQLAADVVHGAEVPFELVEEPGARSTLVSYRPLSAEFVRQRMGELAGLPSHAAAVRELEGRDGLDAYLRTRGEPDSPQGQDARTDAVLRALLARVFAESSAFTFDQENFESAFGELERALFKSLVTAEVISPLRGLTISCSELSLGEGLAVVRGDALCNAPPEIVRIAREGEQRGGISFALLTVEGAHAHAAPVSAARTRFRRLLTALRLFNSGAFVVGPAAWTRLDGGPWRIASLATGGRVLGAAYHVEGDELDELRAFYALLSRGVPRGALGWALGRFEMACERRAPFEALTDHLLALRALLEPEGPASGRLADRLAAICAPAAGRAELAERVAYAISLERAIVTGLPPAHPGVDSLVEELAAHLRALLRDVVCGHLEVDLATVADRALGEASLAL